MSGGAWVHFANKNRKPNLTCYCRDHPADYSTHTCRHNPGVDSSKHEYGSTVFYALPLSDGIPGPFRSKYERIDRTPRIDIALTLRLHSRNALVCMRSQFFVVLIGCLLCLVGDKWNGVCLVLAAPLINVAHDSAEVVGEVHYALLTVKLLRLCHRVVGSVQSTRHVTCPKVNISTLLTSSQIHSTYPGCGFDGF